MKQIEWRPLFWRNRHVSLSLWVRGGCLLSLVLFLGYFTPVKAVDREVGNIERSEEADNNNGASPKKTSVSDKQAQTYNNAGLPVRTERVHVTGHGSTPADQVSGSRANYAAKSIDLGPLGKINPAQAPFSSMTTTHDVMMDQQLRTMDQTLQYMPSVNLEGRGNGVFRLINRGYESDVEQNSRIDGLNAIITTPYATEQFDHVTVVNGTASALFGPESPAGMMMMVQKRPTDKPFFNFNFGYDSNGSPLESIDTSIGKGPVKVRFNYLNQTGQSYTSNSNQHRNLYSGNIDLQLAKHTKLELDGAQYNSGVYGLPGTFVYNSGRQYAAKKDKNGKVVTPASGAMAVTALPDAPNANYTGYGTNDTGMFATTSVGTMKLFHDFTKTIHLRLGGLYEDAARNSFSANNTLYAQGSNIGLGSNAKGPAYQCSSSYCYAQTMKSSSAANDFKTWSNFAYLNWDVTDPIFHIRHKLNVGSNGYSLNNFNPVASAAGMTGMSTINVGAGGLYDPYSGVNSPGLNSNGNVFGSGQVAPGVYWNNANPKGQGSYKSQATIVQDVMFGDSFDVGDYFTVMGQFAWGWIKGNTWDNTGKETTKYVNGKNVLNSNGSFDPSVGLTFHPTKRFAAYFNWGQDTAPGTGLSYTDAAGKNQLSVTGPQRSTQYEGAIKYNWHDRFLVSLGGFGMSRPFTIGNVATSSNGGYAGNQNDMGMEFTVSGALTRELSMYGGVTYDHARYHCTQGDMVCRNLGFTNGPVSSVVGVAPWQSDFLLDWHPIWLHGVSFNTNIRYQGARPSNTAGATVSDVTTLDLGVRYVTHIADHMLVLRGNIDNVTNQQYWGSMFNKDQSGATAGGFSAELAAPQTWHITASYYF